eukprot:3237910-Amphidinium_carterae.2
MVSKCLNVCEFCVRSIGLSDVLQRGGLSPVAGLVYAASILEQYTFASGARNICEICPALAKPPHQLGGNS